MIQRALRFLVRLALGLFFRRIDVEGRENIPDEGALLILSNVPLDPLVIAAHIRRPTAWLTRESRAGSPLLALVARILPLRRCEGKAASKALLDECCRRGEALCISPEGLSGSELEVFWSRVEGIVQASFERPGGLTVVPVGVFLRKKGRLRSDIFVRFGAPVSAGEIERRATDLSSSFAREQESILLRWEAEAVPPASPRLAERLKGSYEHIEKLPEARALSERIRKYASELGRLGISPAEVFFPMNPARAAFFLLREFELVVIGSPLAIWGFANHILPCLLARWAGKPGDRTESLTILPGLYAFLLAYLIQIAAAWIWVPALWAALYTLLLPYTGYFAILYGERVGGILQRTRTFLRLLFHRGLQVRLIETGRGITEDMIRLAEAASQPLSRR